MSDVLLGVLALLVGLLLVFAGAVTLRFVIAVWGAFVGFSLGAGIVSYFWDSGFLAHASGWLVGFGLAILFGMFAYLYYAVAVVIATVSLGFAIGTALMAAIGVEWNWLVVLVAALLGAVLGVLAVVSRLPHVLLIVVSAFGGSAAVVSGIMLLTGVVHTSEFTNALVTRDVVHEWFWYVIYLALAFVGIFSQTRSAARWDDAAWESRHA